ncbi:MAG: hypothetical protein ABWZ79_16730, partial [Pedobacter agri]
IFENIVSDKPKKLTPKILGIDMDDEHKIINFLIKNNIYIEQHLTPKVENYLLKNGSDFQVKRINKYSKKDK